VLAVCLSGCAASPAIVGQNSLNGWIGAHLHEVVRAWPAPSMAHRNPDGTVRYEWGGGTECVSLGYRVSGQYIMPSGGCSSFCSWEATSSASGLVISARVTGGDADQCNIPKRSDPPQSDDLPRLGLIHIDDVEFIPENTPATRMQMLDACDVKYKAGERVWIGQLTGTPGLWPAAEVCCMARTKAVCAPNRIRKSLFDLF
jgi:hypothetical protein